MKSATYFMTILLCLSSIICKGLTWEISRHQHGRQYCAFQFSSCIEFFQAVHSLLSGKRIVTALLVLVHHVSPVEYRGDPLPLANPGVFESLLCPDPLGRVDCQHLVDQVLGLETISVIRSVFHHDNVWVQDLWGDRVPLWAGVIIGPRLYLGVQPVLVLVPERGVTHQQDVQDHT